ncbi:unnamed protein product, partial [Nesidiocoris tenuis]
MLQYLIIIVVPTIRVTIIVILSNIDTSNIDVSIVSKIDTPNINVSIVLNFDTSNIDPSVVIPTCDRGSSDSSAPFADFTSPSYFAVDPANTQFL